MNKIEDFQLTKMANQLAKILIWVSHKSVFKTTAIGNMAYAKSMEGYRVLVIDTDGVSTVQMFLEACFEETEKRILKNKAKIEFLIGKGRVVNQSLRNQLERDEFSIENRPVVIAKSLHDLAAEIDFIKRDYGHYDYIFIDVPAKVLDSKNQPIKELKKLMSFSDLVITPYKGDSQNTVTAVTVSDIIENLKHDAANNGGKFNAKVRSLLAFEPSRIKANTKAVNAKITLTDTSTSIARLARNAERKALKEQDRTEQMKAQIQEFRESYGEHQNPLNVPMIFRSIYPNQFSKAETIYTSTTESAKLAQAEFNMVIDAIISALDEPDSVEVA
ncbi:ParA family protein [Pseudomonas amygdali]|uniref:ParA family protein n=1 Tax=Pseudomonas amygdali TaxID=47877 RepID=UPI000EFEF4FE|nr:AAA family ATPase [Pseudomonas amygdali]